MIEGAFAASVMASETVGLGIANMGFGLEQADTAKVLPLGSHQPVQRVVHYILGEIRSTALPLYVPLVGPTDCPAIRIARYKFPSATQWTDGPMPQSGIATKAPSETR